MTYSNLISATQADGTDVLYDFFRGERFDPVVLGSADVGRTWVSLGQLLRDPLDDPDTRPYVQYRSTTQARIDFIATEAHPDTMPTAIYHGYVEGGLVHQSDGTPLGPVGSAIPVTALTRVWGPVGSERGWTADLVADPDTGALTVAFSVRLSVSDHRYWLAGVVRDRVGGGRGGVRGRGPSTQLSRAIRACSRSTRPTPATS